MVKLKTPSAPFSPVFVTGESITIDTSGKVLVLPTGDPDILPSFNEYTLSSNRLSIDESPFGGYNGSLDYAVGSVHVTGDNCYLTDIAGNNQSKDLSAGKLQSLEYMTVDTDAHTITEEFIVENTGESNNPTVIDACDSTDGWSVQNGTGTISISSGHIEYNGNASASGSHTIQKTFSVSDSMSNFILFKVKNSQPANLRAVIYSGTSDYIYFSTSRFSVNANTDTHFVLPLNSPQGSTTCLPTLKTVGYEYGTIVKIAIGIEYAVNNSANIFDLYYIKSDSHNTAYIETKVPDNLSASSLQLYTHNGTAYQLCRTDSLDSTYSNVSGTSANCTFADGTKLDDVYGTGLGRAIFPKGSAGETKTGSSGNITYSTVQGTDKRIGFRIDLPPSDNGRTNFNKVRITSVITYKADSEGQYSYTHLFENSTDNEYGLQNLSTSFIGLLDPSTKIMDFYLFNTRPKNLKFMKNESGEIYKLIMYPGNGTISYGQITHPDITRDSNSDDIPDILDSNFIGSVTKFLEVFGYADYFLTTLEGDFITTLEGETWMVN